jgi:hypothetical protein
MASLSEDQVRKRLASSVQKALHKHKVSAEDLGETARFLAQVLGAMISIFPVADRPSAIGDLRSDIEYGIANGVPED